MRKLLYIALGMMLLSATSCKTDEIDRWNSRGFVWFTYRNNDFTFRTRPEVGEGESTLVAIPFKAATKVSDKDRVVEVEVSRKPLDSRTLFEIQKPVTFRANHLVDTMFVKVTNSAHLAEVHDTISFRILPSEDFDLGLEDNLETNLCLFNGFAKPKWWDANCDYYLGYFTQLKMEVYFAVTGGDEAPYDDEGWGGNKRRFISYQLTEYVTKNDVRYPDTDPDAPGQQPQFANKKY
ncbi:MAG: DUF4843 domain-containing protein [Bacteroidales bacterium]|nr:DUF4843 domain-containing protein [Bacteroidales bacterium]